jgi:phospholipid-binding lipoprotein MlaA
LPFLGPSIYRDAGGKVVDTITSPWPYVMNEYVYAGYRTVDVIDGREGILNLTNEIERTSLDPYAAIRSLYLQSRADSIRNGLSKQ